GQGRPAEAPGRVMTRAGGAHAAPPASALRSFPLLPFSFRPPPPTQEPPRVDMPEASYPSPLRFCCFAAGRRREAPEPMAPGPGHGGRGLVTTTGPFMYRQGKQTAGQGDARAGTGVESPPRRRDGAPVGKEADHGPGHAEASVGVAQGAGPTTVEPHHGRRSDRDRWRAGGAHGQDTGALRSVPRAGAERPRAVARRRARRGLRRLRALRLRTGGYGREGLPQAAMAPAGS